MNIVDNGEYEFKTMPGLVYQFSASGDIADGALTVEWLDSENNWTVYPDGILYSAGIVTFRAASCTGRVNLVDSGGPNLDVDVTRAFDREGSGVNGFATRDAANETIAGSRIFTGQMQATGQIVFDGSSLLTVALGDDRYFTKYAVTTLNQDVTNSTVLTDSNELQLSLEVGTWEIESINYVDSSAYATAGSKCALVFTGAGTIKGTAWRGAAAATQAFNQTLTWFGSGTNADVTNTSTTFSQIMWRIGRIVVTSPGALKCQFAQGAAVSAHYARMTPGSFLRASRVA